MMKIILIFLSVIGALISGCIEQNEISTNITQNPVSSLSVNSTDTVSSTPPGPMTTDTMEPATNSTVNLQTKSDKFVLWLKTDKTNKHPYVKDNSKAYEEQ